MVAIYQANPRAFEQQHEPAALGRRAAHSGQRRGRRHLARRPQRRDPPAVRGLARQRVAGRAGGAEQRARDDCGWSRLRAAPAASGSHAATGLPRVRSSALQAQVQTCRRSSPTRSPAGTEGCAARTTCRRSLPPSRRHCARGRRLRSTAPRPAASRAAVPLHSAAGERHSAAAADAAEPRPRLRRRPRRLPRQQQQAPTPAPRVAHRPPPKPASFTPTASPSMLDTLASYWWALAAGGRRRCSAALGSRIWRSRRQSEFDDSLGRLAAAGRTPSPYTRLEPSTADTASDAPAAPAADDDCIPRRGERARTSGRGSPQPRRPLPPGTSPRR